jgi:hypothetical protein
MLSDFQYSKSHMVAVENDDHNAVGILTLEDLLKEILERRDIAGEVTKDAAALTPAEFRKQHSLAHVLSTRLLMKRGGGALHLSTAHRKTLYSTNANPVAVAAVVSVPGLADKRITIDVNNSDSVDERTPLTKAGQRKESSL